MALSARSERYLCNDRPITKKIDEIIAEIKQDRHFIDALSMRSPKDLQIDHQVIFIGRTLSNSVTSIKVNEFVLHCIGYNADDGIQLTSETTQQFK